MNCPAKDAIDKPILLALQLEAIAAVVIECN
jgi:hypothetical protein